MYGVCIGKRPGYGGGGLLKFLLHILIILLILTIARSIYKPIFWSRISIPFVANMSNFQTTLLTWRFYDCTASKLLAIHHLVDWKAEVPPSLSQAVIHYRSRTDDGVTTRPGLRPSWSVCYTDERGPPQPTQGSTQSRQLKLTVITRGHFQTRHNSQIYPWRKPW